MADARLDGTAIADSVIDLIGHTPLVRMKRTMELEQLPAVLAMKMETTNPGGSAKDRPALEMILAAERDGLLTPGQTIVEPTSGNTGIGLAIVAAQRGYQCVFVMTDKVAPEKVSLLQAYGAEVVVCPVAVAPDDERSYYRVAERLTHERHAFRPNQYANPNNPLAHTKTTGPEIWEQTAGRITHFVAGAGTCGTLTGTARFLKQQNPAIRIIAADPEGSVFSGGSGRPYLVEGVGEDFFPAAWQPDLYDDVIPISDEQSFLTARRISRTEGILIGGSGGLAVAAAIKVAKRAGPDDIVVVLNPDSGRGYLSRVFDDRWMANFGFLVECDQCIAAVLDARHDSQPELIYVNPAETVQTAIRGVGVGRRTRVDGSDRPRPDRPASAGRGRDGAEAAHRGDRPEAGVGDRDAAHRTGVAGAGGRATVERADPDRHPVVLRGPCSGRDATWVRSNNSTGGRSRRSPSMPARNPSPRRERWCRRSR
jgi:cystathionine beta-synthase